MPGTGDDVADRVSDVVQRSRQVTERGRRRCRGRARERLPEPRNDAIEVFVRREIERGELAIGKPPLLPEVTPIRDVLLQDSVVWERGGGIGDEATTKLRAMLMTTALSIAFVAWPMT